jgi:hypothetical protein
MSAVRLAIRRRYLEIQFADLLTTCPRFRGDNSAIRSYRIRRHVRNQLGDESATDYFEAVEEGRDELSLVRERMNYIINCGVLADRFYKNSFNDNDRVVGENRFTSHEIDCMLEYAEEAFDALLEQLGFARYHNYLHTRDANHYQKCLGIWHELLSLQTRNRGQFLLPIQDATFCARYAILVSNEIRVTQHPSPLVLELEGHDNLVFVNDSLAVSGIDFSFEFLNGEVEDGDNDFVDNDFDDGPFDDDNAHDSDFNSPAGSEGEPAAEIEPAMRSEPDAEFSDGDSIDAWF